MPERKMDKRQMNHFRDQLLRLKENILHDIKNMTNVNSTHSKESVDDAGGGHGLHMADVATDMYDKEFNLNLAANDKELLNKIDAALLRVDEKLFGKCSICKKNIPLVRLKAIPYTETCLKCQEGLETKA